MICVIYNENETSASPNYIFCIIQGLIMWSLFWIYSQKNSKSPASGAAWSQEEIWQSFNFFDNVDYRQQMIWPIGSYSTIIYIVVCSERVEPYYLSQSRDKWRNWYNVRTTKRSHNNNLMNCRPLNIWLHSAQHWLHAYIDTSSGHFHCLRLIR